MTSVNRQNFERLIDRVYQTCSVLQEQTLKVINQNLTVRNWLVGYYIVEYEQNGEDRARYGTKLIDEISKTLKMLGLKGFSPIALRNCRLFYIRYPQIQQTLSVKLSNEFNIRLGSPKEIQQAPSVELDNEALSPELLLSKLSYSHFIELIRVENALERLFYEVETIKNNWSVRELERAIGSSLFARTGLSKNKHRIDLVFYHRILKCHVLKNDTLVKYAVVLQNN